MRSGDAMRLYAGSCVLWPLAALLSVVFTASAETVTPDALRADLFASVTLAGHYCERVVDVDSRSEGDYLVRCATGDSYRVTRTESNQVLVSLPGRAPAPEVLDHRQQVQRHLFAIVNLSGQACDRVTGWKRYSRGSYRVQCRNGGLFGVAVNAAGRVVVAKQ